MLPLLLRFRRRSESELLVAVESFGNGGFGGAFVRNWREGVLWAEEERLQKKLVVARSGDLEEFIGFGEVARKF